MKKLLLLLSLISIQSFANEPDSRFYEPSVSNKYQGRLAYDPAKNNYPIEEMKKLCEQFTGIDTAQIKCKKQSNKKISICEYKCSLHWLVD